MNTAIQKCNNNEVTVCWKDFCVTAGGILGVLVVIGFVAYTVSEAANAIQKLAK